MGIADGYPGVSHHSKGCLVDGNIKGFESGGKGAGWRGRGLDGGKGGWMGVRGAGWRGKGGWMGE